MSFSLTRKGAGEERSWLSHGPNAHPTPGEEGGESRSGDSRGNIRGEKVCAKLWPARAPGTTSKTKLWWPKIGKTLSGGGRGKKPKQTNVVPEAVEAVPRLTAAGAGGKKRGKSAFTFGKTEHGPGWVAAEREAWEMNCEWERRK